MDVLVNIDPFEVDFTLMTHTLSFIRILFVLLSVLFLSVYTTTSIAGGLTLTNLAIGVTTGLCYGLIVISTEVFIRRFQLKSFLLAALGLLFGYLMGQSIYLIFDTVIHLSDLPLDTETLSLIKIALFLLTSYIGMVMTALGADELYLSIPFFRFQSMNLKQKALIFDPSVVQDPRLIDLTASGILDTHAILPRFVIKELMNQTESCDENIRIKAKRGLEVIKKLEQSSEFKLRIDDTDYPEIKDMFSKLLKLAREKEANIFTADISKMQQSSAEGIRIINFHHLANALKPISQTGEQIEVKIQRTGKDARQGVGYLDDGTMVVVNGGADFMGQTIRASVLSVKHTSSGRLIFCNVLESEDRLLCTFENMETPRHYFLKETSYS